MVYNTAQWLGLGAFTVAVLVIGMLLLKLDRMIGTNYDVAESEPAAPPSVAPAAAPHAAVSSPRAGRRKSAHGRKH